MPEEDWKRCACLYRAYVPRSDVYYSPQLVVNWFLLGGKKESRKKVMIMTSKLLHKCGEVCQQKIVFILLVLLGLISFGMVMFVVLNF